MRELTEDALEGFDLALFSAGSGTSRRFAPEAVRRGCVVVDKSSAFRMDPAVPLVVPEVNGDAASAHRGIVANPNCSTIQLVVALKPLHDAARIRQIDDRDLPGRLGHRQPCDGRATLAVVGALAG